MTPAPLRRPTAPGGIGAGAGGVVLAQVADVDDPQVLGRVQVRLQDADGLAGQAPPMWSMVVAPCAPRPAGERPALEVGDLVVLTFVQGDARMPVVLGRVGPPRRASPVPSPLTLDLPGGQTLTVQDGPGECSVTDMHGNRVVMHAGGVRVEAPGKVEVQASQVTISAGVVTVDAGMARISGVVQCETLIANAVVAASYSPGAGNVL